MDIRKYLVKKNLNYVEGTRNYEFAVTPDDFPEFAATKDDFPKIELTKEDFPRIEKDDKIV